MLRPGPVDRPPTLDDYVREIAIQIGIRAAEQDLGKRSCALRRKPEHGSEQVGEHVRIGFIGPDGDDSDRGRNRRSDILGPLGTPVTLELALQTEMVPDIELKSATAS